MWYRQRVDPPIRAFRVGYDDLPTWVIVESVWGDRDGVTVEVVPNPTPHTAYALPVPAHEIQFVCFKNHGYFRDSASHGDWVIFDGTFLDSMLDDEFQERYEETLVAEMSPSPEPESEPLSLYEMFIRQGLF